MVSHFKNASALVEAPTEVPSKITTIYIKALEAVLLMHAMGPNVAGVIGTAVAAGTFMAMFGVR